MQQNRTAVWFTSDAPWRTLRFSLSGARKNGCLGGFSWIVLSLTLLAGPLARAQAAAEYGGAVSSMGSVGASIGTTQAVLPSTLAAPREATFASPAPQKATVHLSVHVGASNEDANRQALEQEAGEDAGKLLLRSTPTKAAVWIEGKRVGSTPLLLVLAPGAYRVELRGSRMEFAGQRVDLQARETRELNVPLEQRYPSHVRLLP